MENSKEKWRESISTELFGNVIPFWLQYSNDDKNGGFYACLDQLGNVYDKRKFMWLNGRQIWMYSKICLAYTGLEMETLSKGKMKANDRQLMIERALEAAVFMVENGTREEDGQIYFSLTEDGKPCHIERKIFSACFLCLGLGTLR